MTKLNINALDSATVFGEDDKKIGTVGQVYLDDQTQEPTFVTVNTGLFGTKETFVPVDKATSRGGDLHVPYTKDFVKDAPNLDADGHLSPAAEEKLYRHYKMEYSAATSGNKSGDNSNRTTGTDCTAVGGTKATDGESVVAREERLRVGTEEREAGRARLRKHVVSDTQRVEVPVKREELVVDREGIDPNSAEARQTGGIDANAGGDETVTLREERPVVDKETVATERVNVGKRMVQDSETVQGEVRKEKIDVDEVGTDRNDRR